MVWYYVEAGQQAGPADEAQLPELVRTGKIQPDTLVWHEGMTNWQPFREVAPPSILPPAPPAGLPPAPGTAQPRLAPPETAPPLTDEVTCAECHNRFTKDKASQYGTVWVCANCRPNFLRRFQGQGPAVSGFHYGGFWIRFAAKIIDQLILGVVLGLPYGLLIFFTSMHNGMGAGQPPDFAFIAFQLVGALVMTLLSVAYYGIFLGKFGATPGKMVCGLKVVAPDGTKITYGRAFGRSFAEILSGLICDIGYIIAAFDSEKRALHDHLANTRVIYK